MLKFLRKYSKWLLIIFGVLLMVAFTAPQAIQQLGRAMTNRVVATLDGREIRLEELAQAERQYAILRQRLPRQVLPSLSERNEGLHWLMLVEEARRAGLIGVAGDGAMWVEDFAPQIALQQVEQQLAQQLGPQLASQFARQQWAMMDPKDRQAMIDSIAAFLRTPPPNVDEREYHQALSVARGINRLINGYFESAPMSDARARLQAARLRRTAWVEAIWASGHDLAEIAGEPTEQQLIEHYERFADTPMGQGPYGIGYTLPERLRIEYLKIDRPAIERAIEPDPLEVRKRYQAQLREAQAQGREPPSFEQARSGIEQALRREIAEEVVRAAQQAFVGVMGEATRALESDGAYKKLPEDFDQQRPSFESVAEQMVQAVSLTAFPKARGGKVQLPLPEVVRPDRWLWPQALAELEGFGQAQVAIGSASAPIAQVLFAVRELRPQMGARLAIQKGLPLVDVPAMDADGSVYYATVLDVRPRSKPDSIEQIRPQLVRDWQALTAYERMAGLADEMAALAAEQGLTAAAVELWSRLGASGEPPTPQTVRVTPDAVTLAAGLGPRIVGPLDAPAFREAVMQVFDRLDPLTPIDQTPRADRTLGVPIDATLTLAVGTIDRILPLTIEAYRQQADDLDLVLRVDELRDALAQGNPFGFDAMRQRLGLRIVGQDGSAADPSGESAQRQNDPADASPTDADPGQAPPPSSPTGG